MRIFLKMERTGIEPVTSGLQIPGINVELGQITSIKAKLRWFDAIEIRYSGTRFGTRFFASVAPQPWGLPQGRGAACLAPR
jgi:hypothetical protein